MKCKELCGYDYTTMLNSLINLTYEKYPSLGIPNFEDLKKEWDHKEVASLCYRLEELKCVLRSY